MIASYHNLVSKVNFIKEFKNARKLSSVPLLVKSPACMNISPLLPLTAYSIHLFEPWVSDTASISSLRLGCVLIYLSIDSGCIVYKMNI